MHAKSSHAQMNIRMYTDENNHNYEIDFLLSRGNKICLIEVKSSGYKTHKSDSAPKVIKVKR